MSRSSRKADRLLQMEQILLSCPQGIRRAEIARRLGVHRATVGRDIDELSLRLPIWEVDNLLGIDRDQYLTHVRLTIHESMALHLAARLMATRMDKHNPHAAAALRKLGSALDAFSPQVSRHLLTSADAMDDATQRQDPVYLNVLETLTRAWSDGLVVHLWHRMPNGQVFEYDFAPYFIEPYAVGQTTHVIGWREPPGAVRTFKLERVQRIQLTTRAYTVPADFDLRAQLADAWGIWFTESEPVEVALKFHARVAPRVRETRWHRSERIEEAPDGGLVWRARIAEPQEMLPWIRGWGADAEVLAPQELRDELIGEARRLTVLYGVAAVPAYQLLWAKTNNDGTQTHPLICHMIDVAQVALTMWKEIFPETLRARFAKGMGLDLDGAGRALAVLTGLHDLGKACPGFQRKHPPAVDLLAGEGLEFERLFVREPFYHGIATASTLEGFLQENLGILPEDAKMIARAVGGHHGEWPLPVKIQHLKSAQVGSDRWDAVRQELVDVMIKLFSPPDVQQLGRNQEETNALVALLSGFTSIADWIGSMETYFPYARAPVGVERYAERAALQSSKALRELGWQGWRPPTDFASFEELFGFSPRPMQQAVIELSEQLDRPALVIIESPTGGGKTEAALFLADHWAYTCQQRGLYVAMPTMATSNQMYARVSEFVTRRYPRAATVPLLVHSQARWQEDVPDLGLKTADERNDGTVTTMGWFLPRKRSLLAPFGVGTVDQALLSVLQARHFFVRLYGLSHKTVVFDEVHAYDTYMSTLFQRLLSWLSKTGTSVVILSATLPERTRREFIQAYSGSSNVDIPSVDYPSITWAMDGQVDRLALKAANGRKLTVEWVDRTAESIVYHLSHALKDGGCAAVICNTVGRAQEVYQTLERSGVFEDEHLMLFHARFPLVWRDEIEKHVLSRFSKDGVRPQKAVVVATQVIEQSLDLDFDLMVTDVAPIDLVLQRAGRLHRHNRQRRPPLLSAPRLMITRPMMEGGVPDFGNDGYVYEAYVLSRSLLALQGLTEIVLPSDTEALIQAVYGEEKGVQHQTELSSEMVEALDAAWHKMQQRQVRELDQARIRLVPEPANERMMSISASVLEEDRPELHQALRALTRLIPPSVSLVCLHRTAEGIFLGPDGNGVRLDLSQQPTTQLTYQLALRTLSVTSWPVVEYFLAQSVPKGWHDHPLLHNHRAAIFENGECSLGGLGYVLRLSRDLGLVINREAQ